MVQEKEMAISHLSKMLQIYNTLARKKESFEPIHKNKVDIFVCGPTVYDYSHLGHARTYLVFDMMAKYLKSRGYKVDYVQNITDIDDKIINRAKEENISPKELAQKFEKEYLKDMDILKISGVSKYARATEHVKEIIGQVEKLLKKEFAYKTKDGIYYDISKFENYGQLSKRTVIQAEDAISRIDESIEKKNKGDFCLWKISKPDEPSWLSPWGNGRPGWHIEDTAIAEKYLGTQYDIHGGAIDLIFPHHEAEIAQMEAISGKSPMVKYWIHIGFLTINGQKMAKSLGNFISVGDFLKKHSPEALRLFVFSTHYRSPIDYTEKAIEQAEEGLERIKEFIINLKIFTGGKQNSRTIQDLISKIENEFEEAMDDDFNTPRALAAIFDLMGKIAPLIDGKQLSISHIKKINKLLADIDDIFQVIPKGLYFLDPKDAENGKIPKEIRDRKEKFKKIVELTKERDQFRQQGQWSEADRIREELEKDYDTATADTSSGTVTTTETKIIIGPY